MPKITVTDHCKTLRAPNCDPHCKTHGVKCIAKDHTGSNLIDINDGESRRTNVENNVSNSETSLVPNKKILKKDLAKRKEDREKRATDRQKIEESYRIERERLDKEEQEKE